MVLSEEYADHLREVRGFAASTVYPHRYASHCFLNHLKAKKFSLVSIQPRDVETYIQGEIRFATKIFLLYTRLAIPLMASGLNLAIVL